MSLRHSVRSLHTVIMGGGAIGCLLTALLVSSSAPPSRITLCSRTRSRDFHYRVQYNKSTATDAPTIIDHRHVHIVNDVDDIDQRVDVVFLTVKGTTAIHNAVASTEVLCRRFDDTIVVPLMNGLTHIPLLDALIRTTPAHLLYATTALGAHWKNDELIHAGTGTTHICDDTDTEKLAGRAMSAAAGIVRQILVDAHIDCAVHPRSETESVIWTKLLANCIVNPLTALLRVRNGALIDLFAVRTLISQLIVEFIDVIAALNIKLTFELNESLLQHKTVRCDRALEYIDSVCKSTAENVSSTLSDVLARRQTEIANLNGELIRIAQDTAHVNVEHHRMLVQLIAAIENTYKLQVDIYQH